MRLQDWFVLFRENFQLMIFFNTTCRVGMTFSSSDLRPGGCPGHAVAEGNKTQQNNINYAADDTKLSPSQPAHIIHITTSGQWGSQVSTLYLLLLTLQKTLNLYLGKLSSVIILLGFKHYIRNKKLASWSWFCKKSVSYVYSCSLLSL